MQKCILSNYISKTKIFPCEGTSNVSFMYSGTPLKTPSWDSVLITSIRNNSKIAFALEYRI